MTLVFLLACVTLVPYSIYAVETAKQGSVVSFTTIIALLVCLIPTTIGGLLSAIGVAGMGRMIAKNVIAMSGRAVEAAGDVDILLLDKTGTITLGDRQATAFLTAPGVTEEGAGRSGPARVDRRPDARGALDHGAREDPVQPARARPGVAQRHVRPVLGADTHER